MIKTFKNKALEKYFSKGSRMGIRITHLKKVRYILALLNTAEEFKDMNLPGLYLHKLKGSSKGRYSVYVNKNWRITFTIVNGDVFDVDYEDYH